MSRKVGVDSEQYQKGKQVEELRHQVGGVKQAAKILGINEHSARRCAHHYRKMRELYIVNGWTIPEDVADDDRSEEEVTDDELEELLELARRGQAAMMKIDPVIVNCEVDLSGVTSPQVFLLAGCMQTGGRWTYHELIRERLENVVNNDNFWIGFFGDDVENFQSGTFAGAMSQYEQALQPPLQRRAWELFLRKVQHRVKWATWSQHGTLWDEREGFSYIKKLYLDAGIPFFDGMGYIRIRCGQQQYKVVVSHELPGSSMYNKNHAQKRALWQRFPNADVIAQADKHQYAITEEDAYKMEYAAGNRQSEYVWLVQIGTAKGGPDKYSIRGWETGATDWPLMVLYPDQHLIKITRHWDDAIAWCGVKGNRNAGAEQ